MPPSQKNSDTNTLSSIPQSTVQPNREESKHRWLILDLRFRVTCTLLYVAPSHHAQCTWMAKTSAQPANYMLLHVTCTTWTRLATIVVVAGWVHYMHVTCTI